MNEYRNKEIKVLNVNVLTLCEKLEDLGAKKVFDNNRARITYDSTNNSLLERGIEIRITEEGTIKLSLDDTNDRSSIEVKINRSKEMQDILKVLDIVPISKVVSYRISYELESIDFDIDQFPEIPPFVEIDLAESDTREDEILSKLDLQGKEIFIGSTIELYKRYDKNYIKMFSIE